MFDPKRLRKARLEAGLTQEQLARRVGTGERNIRRWERATVPRPETVERLAAALGIDPDFFVPATSEWGWERFASTWAASMDRCAREIGDERALV